VKIFSIILLILVLLLVGRLVYLTMTSKAPESTLVNGILRACPGTPNCVSSEAIENAEKIPAFDYSGTAKQAWKSLRLAIEQSGGKVEVSEDAYLRATYTSRIFRFVDDMEFRLDADKQVIHVRSASRVGKTDLGVNRKNVEKVKLIFNNNNQINDIQ